ncbi:MAG: hypothetical protein JWR19_791 [Pedosphaera sp.]|nr:hypothetical protein [Pedosphaera sp.]
MQVASGCHKTPYWAGLSRIRDDWVNTLEKRGFAYKQGILLGFEVVPEAGIEPATKAL